MDTERANRLYEQAVFGGDEEAIWLAERDLDAAEADLSLARGRILHARFLKERKENPRELALFAQAASLYTALGDHRGEGEALFWIGLVHQVVRDDNGTALAYFEQSYELATVAGDKLTASYATRHLGFIDQAAGRSAAARERFEESIRLREEIGFLPGVAAGLLTLAQCIHDESMLDRAAEIAGECGATAVLGWIEQARASL